MYARLVLNPMKSIISTTLPLIDKIPQLFEPLPQSKEELLRVHKTYKQELVEYINLLQLKVNALNEADGKWSAIYIGLSDKLRSEVDEEHMDTEEKQHSVNRVIELAREKLAIAKAKLEMAQETIDDLLRLPSQITTESTQNLEQNNLKLPDLPLLKFDGDVTEWPRFWSAFQRAIDDQKLNDADKLSYLMGLLKDEAAKVVSGYMIREENYEPVVNLLKETYGQRDTIIFHLVKRLRNIKPMKMESELGDKVKSMEQILQQLESLGENINNVSTETMIEEKLSYWTLVQVGTAKEMEQDWNVTKLRSFLRKIALIRGKASDKVERRELKESKLVRNEKSRSRGKEINLQPTSAFACAEKRGFPPRNNDEWKRKLNQGQQRNKGKNPWRKCAFCNGEHFHSKCPIYNNINVRLQRIKALNLCAKCLKKGHVAMECKTNIQPCYYCGKSHHSALCEEACKRENMRERSVQVNISTQRMEVKKCSPDTVAAVQTMNTLKPQEVLLMCKEVELVSPTDSKLKKRVLVFLDPGSLHSYIDEKLAEELQLPVKTRKKLLLSTFSEKIPKEVRAKIVLGDILGKGDEKRRFELQTIDYLTNKLQVVKVSYSECEKIIDDQKILNSTQWKKPKVLLGMDYFFHIIDNFQRISSGYFRIDTFLGPIIAGSGQMDDIEKKRRSAQYAVTDVNEFWELETIGIQREEQAVGDTTALTLFEKNVRRDSEGRYEVSWPWKTSTPYLSDNYWLCRGRLKSVLSRLRVNPSLLEQYNQVFQEQKNLGIIEPVPENYGNTPPLVFFLPHQPVITPKKETTKLRIVFDASAKTKHGKSLNEELYRGPVILPDLVGILLRVRMYKYLIMADVEKAFLQVGLQEKDRNVTQFLWVKDIDKPVTDENLITYRFRRVLFGVIASPFLLAAVIKYHLKQYPSILSNKIQENLYVDNMMVGTNDLNFATDVYRESKTLFEKAYMNLREFATNEKIVERMFKDEDRCTKPEISILGLKWRTREDVFVITTHAWPKGQLTKRTILKFIASHFDPLGIISPLLLPFKIGCQELWKQNRGWDEAIPELLVNEWQKLEHQWQEMEFVIPRWALNSQGELTFHVFVDASTKAYAAVVYGRMEGVNETTVTLLCSKNRIMPIKKLTIPKAELVAAVIGVRLVKFVQTQLKLPANRTYAWSDSRCTIAWIGQENLQKLPRFVENRVNEIQMQNIKFRYVPSAENPADIATKGATIKELKGSVLWWQGPSFLKLSKENWPIENSVNDEITEVNLSVERAAVNMNITECEILRTFGKFIEIERFSHWNHLLRVTQLVLLFLKKFKSKKLEVLCKIPEINFNLVKKQPLKIRITSQTLPILNSAYQLAKIMLLKQAQLDIKQEDIKKWKLILDDDGLWRVHDRLGSLPSLVNNPIFLPRNNRVTELIIMEEHEKQGHAGVSQTLVNLRMSYWIDKSRRTVRQTITKNCMLCRRWKSQPFKLPEMAPLPRERLVRTRPFQHTAVDYAGPFLTRTAQGKLKKKWICLFTCLCTRAVHLQSVEGLSTAEFLEAYDRFTARRGCPETILSDNGTQFLAAADYVKAKWRNITAYAPWQGGVYERLIGLMKNSMRQAIGRKLLKEQEWETLIVRTEGILNSRPICQLNDDTRDALRPIDFLLPSTVMEDSWERITKEQGELYIPHTQEQVLKYFTGTEKCLERLWKFWYTGYLHNLRERSNQTLKQRHCCTPRTPQVGEIVLLELNETFPRGKWPLARVISIPPGKDGKVRTANVKLSNGRILKRAVSQLYPLEIENLSTQQSDNNVMGDPNLEEEIPEEELEPANVITTKHKVVDKKKKKNGLKNGLFFLFLILQSLCTKASGLIAYDCIHRNSKVTMINAREVRPCVINEKKPRTSQQNIQLIQLANSYSVQVQQCKIMLLRTITHCGMFSHSSVVDGGQLTYMLTVGESMCKEIHATKQYHYSGSLVFDDLEPDKVHSRTATIIGSLDREGNCVGGFYSDQYGSWHNVVVVGSFMITLTTYHSEASTTADEIRLRSQLVCKFSRGYCIDMENGETVWQPEVSETCGKERHVVLYEGLANILQEEEGDPSNEATFTVTEGQKIFALRTVGKLITCPFPMYQTEHPKLLIVPQTGHFYFEKKIVEPGALDLLTYMNAKFVFLDKTIGQNLEVLHKHLSYQRCMLERKTLLTQLSLAYIDPIEFAYAYTGEPGYMAQVAGEVINLISCSPVEVSRRSTPRCYSELPITWNNESYFMAPRSRVIQKRGTELPCNDIIRPMFQLSGSWYSLNPHISTVSAPQLLSPIHDKDFKYKSPGELASGGIYNEAEIEKLRTQLMYPNERTAITNIITRGMLNKAPDMQGLSLKSMMDDTVIEKIQNSMWQKMWGGFSKFGIFMSGILGILLIIQIIKWLLDTVVHGKILFDLYGLSSILCTAIWNSLAMYFIYKKQNKIHQMESVQKVKSKDQVEQGNLTSCIVIPKEGGIINEQDDNQRKDTETTAGIPLYPLPKEDLTTASASIKNPTFMQYPMHYFSEPPNGKPR